jgi:serine carboxypeptidase-like clade 2
MLQWFLRFPMYTEHEFYISGESYAGVYVPYLAKRILDYNNQIRQLGGHLINLKGIIVGNGVTNWVVDGNPSFIEMSYYHGLYPKSFKDTLELENCDFRETPPNYNSRPECNELLAKFMNYTKYINVYDVYRASDDPDTPLYKEQLQYTRWRLNASYKQDDIRRILQETKKIPGL